MPLSFTSRLLTAVFLAALAIPAFAQTSPSDFAALADSENANNAQPGPRTAPSKIIPVPTVDVSPAMQAVIAGPFRGAFWNVDPKTSDEWKQYVARWAALSTAPLASIRERLGVTMEEATIDGVHVYIL